jgi:NADPH:quinone reductase-like Zn-dependent oxidoreductase
LKAIRFHEYGPPDVLRCEDVPPPKPDAGQVLVKVHAAAANPVDCAVRAGFLRSLREYTIPLILGWDFSGVVEDVGPGVHQWRIGDEVFGHPPIPGSGTYCEYIAVAESVCARKPANLDHIHAAAIPLVGLTAWQALFEHAQLRPGDLVLIQAGAGGVGSFAIQFAKLAGAHVAATASGRNQDFLRELGAERPINYETQRFEDWVHDADVVIDGLAGSIRERCWSVLKPGGILIALTMAPPRDADAAARGIRQQTLWVHGDQERLSEIAKLADAGTVRPFVQTVLPLRDAAEAHRMLETHHTRGKIVLQIV